MLLFFTWKWDKNIFFRGNPKHFWGFTLRNSGNWIFFYFTITRFSGNEMKQLMYGKPLLTFHISVQYTKWKMRVIMTYETHSWCNASNPQARKTSEQATGKWQNTLLRLLAFQVPVLALEMGHPINPEIEQKKILSSDLKKKTFSQQKSVIWKGHFFHSNTI